MAPATPAASAAPWAISRRSLLGLGTATLALPGCALQPRSKNALESAPPVTLPDSRQIDMAAGGHVHRIMIAVPPAPPPAHGYPVLYVLDGNLLFALTAQLMRNRFARGPGVPTQGAVIVGLGYAGAQVLDLDARSYDYTPPAPGPVHDERGRREGGADAFLDFVDATVRPLVADTAPIDDARQTLFGHSYGGLCALHALFTRPGGFRNYVAASPSLWWRDGFILQEQQRFLAGRRVDAPPLNLLVSQGELEARPPADPARAISTRGQRNVELLSALADGLRRAPNLELRLATFPGADHGSAMVPAAQQALALAIETTATLK